MKKIILFTFLALCLVVNFTALTYGGFDPVKMLIDTECKQ
jgi:hypothetical protein